MIMSLGSELFGTKEALGAKAPQTEEAGNNESGA